MTDTKAKRVAGAAAIVMISLILSRLTGFLRSILVNNLPGKEGDILMAGFLSTDFMYNLLIGGAISAALIPVLAGYVTKNEEEEGWKAVSTFINIIILAMVAVSILGIIFAPQVVAVFVSGYPADKREITIKLTRILFPSVAFIMMAGFTNGVLNSYQRFAAAAMGPVVYNICTIICLAILGRFNLVFIAIGWVGASLTYFLFQFFFAHRHFKFYKPAIDIRNKGFQRLLMLAIPSIIASAIAQINLVVTSSFTSHFGDGSYISLTGARDVWQLPYGIFAIGIGTAILPSLSGMFAKGELKSYKGLIEKSLKSVLFLTIPSAVGVVVLSKPIVSVIYKWSHAYTPWRIETTGNILAFFSIALFMQSAIIILNRAFYAANDTKTPLFIGGGSLIINILFCGLFYLTTNLGPSGMALAYSISSVLNCIVLLYILNKRSNKLNIGGISAFTFKIAFASVVMGAAIILLKIVIPLDFTKVFNMEIKIKEIIVLAIFIGTGALAFFSAVLLMRVEEAHYAVNLVIGRIKRITAMASGVLRK